MAETGEYFFARATSAAATKKKNQIPHRDTHIYIYTQAIKKIRFHTHKHRGYSSNWKEARPVVTWATDGVAEVDKSTPPAPA